MSLHSNFYLYKNFFWKIINDGEGTNIFWYENISDENSGRVNEFITINWWWCYMYVDVWSVESFFWGRKYTLHAGMYQSTEEWVEITIHPNTRVVIYQRESYRGINSIGILEEVWRLKYIDWCTDSMLCSPIKKGDPCLNALFVPNWVNQTMHIHPSTRAGFIIQGEGRCETPEKTYKLESGLIFFLPKNWLHKFRTDADGEWKLRVVAYHPDSDFWPSDEIHPMINRTIVDGVSASLIKEIQTK
jgi:mannose-6-phosphate isomerase-like protein (cupin superfamily)